MDVHLGYWTWAWVNMTIAVGCALAGVRRIRRGEVAAHRRAMLAAAGLVALFIASYVVKVLVLGKEDLSGWSDGSLLMLRLHETCVLAMLLGGAWAGLVAHRIRKAGIQERDANGLPETRRVHRRAGWVAVAASALGMLTAGLVLGGMYERAEHLRETRAALPQVVGEAPDEG